MVFVQLTKPLAPFSSHVEFMMMIFVEAILKPNGVASLALWYSFSMATFVLHVLIAGLFLSLLHMQNAPSRVVLSEDYPPWQFSAEEPLRVGA